MRLSQGAHTQTSRSIGREHSPSPIPMQSTAEPRVCFALCVPRFCLRSIADHSRTRSGWDLCGGIIKADARSRPAADEIFTEFHWMENLKVIMNNLFSSQLVNDLMIES